VKRAAVGLFGAAMVAAAIVSYPPDPALRFEPGLIGWPDGGKLAAVLLSCAALVALDLAAYGAGAGVHRLLHPAAPRSRLAVLEQMALGFLVLSCGVLALAALRALHRSLIVGAVVVLAIVGATAVFRGVRRPAPSPRGLFVAAGGAVLLASPFLAAWMPDYGWDAFAYHLALPERYLFRNRIVVTPLFPHSAFPQTVEMLYLIALSLDSGALAKLIHLQFGVLTALAVFAMARSASMRAGLLAVAILAADPLFNWELAVAYNDLAATLFAVLAAAAFEEWRRTNAAASLRAAAVFAGACVSVRYPAGAVPVAMAALIWLGAPWRAWRPKLAASLKFAGAATLVLSPWLLRNLVLTGNPVSPAAQSVFHAPGQEYFDPVALEQSLAFTRSVGFGRGIDDLVLLPVNLSLRARIGDYTGFGFRIGVLYVVGAVAFLLARGHHIATAAATALKLAGLLTVLWFVSFQEPRYLLPALCLIAVAGGVGLDAILPRRRSAAALLWVVPIAALVHTQWSAAVLLPWRYGYALGDLPVAAFEAQEPALAVVPALRRAMGPGDRLLPIHEPRGFFYRGMDYVPATAPEVMQLVHRSPSPEAFAERLRALGVTHVLVNANNVGRYRTWHVEGYGPQDEERALALLEAFLARHTAPVIEDRGVIVRKLRTPDS
jgi:4-amino-4-deoxy-L-arabinose transferase-like glycosyltransferase